MNYLFMLYLIGLALYLGCLIVKPEFIFGDRWKECADAILKTQLSHGYSITSTAVALTYLALAVVWPYFAWKIILREWRKAQARAAKRG